MNTNENWNELYRQSRRNAPIESPQPIEPRRPPVPTGEVPSGVTVIRPIKVDEHKS